MKTLPFIFSMMILFYSGCKSTNPHHYVQLVDSRSYSTGKDIHSLDFQQIENAIKFRGFYLIGNIDVIAWSLKMDHRSELPRLFEEVIVCASWQHELNETCCGLFYLRRFSNSTGSLDRRWRLSGTEPPLIVAKCFTQMPGVAEIGKFIRETNFGHNEFDDSLNVIRVISYWKSSDIIKSLVEGVSISEKASRLQKYLNSVATPDNI